MTITAEIQSFLHSLNSEHTVRSYATPLRRFSTFLGESGLSADAPTSSLTVDHAIEFAAWLREGNPLSKATVQLYLTAVYRFYRFLLKGGLSLEASDMARLEEVYRDARNIRGDPRPKDHRLETVQAVIEAAHAVPSIRGLGTMPRNRELTRLRDIAIVETLRATGCRVGELVGLCRGDRDRETRSALVKGKGSKWRTVYWDADAWKALEDYLSARGQEGPSVPLFCGHGNRSGNRQPLTTRHVSRIVSRLAESAGASDVSPHYFRHVFATRALERTENLALVQDLLGHASPTTTRVYARTDEAQRQAAHQRVWG